MPAPTIVVGAPCWNDLFSSDTDRAKAFYGELFGWTTMDPGPEYGGYFLFQKDGKVVAGCMAQRRRAGRPGHVDDLPLDRRRRRTAEAARRTAAGAHGADGRDPERPMHVARRPGRSGDRRLAAARRERLRDPRRARRARLVRAAHARLRQSVAFYRDVFGWDAHTVGDTDEFRYTTLGEGETALAGIMDGPTTCPRGPPGRSTSPVADVDATLARPRSSAARSGGRRGHAVRPARHRPRSDGGALPADGPEQQLTPSGGGRARGAAPPLAGFLLLRALAAPESSGGDICHACGSRTPRSGRSASGGRPAPRRRPRAVEAVGGAPRDRLQGALEDAALDRPAGDDPRGRVSGNAVVHAPAGFLSRMPFQTCRRSRSGCRSRRSSCPWRRPACSRRRSSLDSPRCS